MRLRGIFGSTRPEAAGEEAGELERKLVWILGSPRSGSTWLLNLMVQEPGFVKIDEPLVGAHLGMMMMQITGAPARAQGPATALLAEEYAERSDYLFADRYEDVWRPELRRLVLRRFAAQLEASGAAVRTCLVKEPHGSQAAPMLMRLLPQSRLLWLLRDGRDVVDSEVDGISSDGWLQRHSWNMTRDERIRYVEDRASLWLRRTEATQDAYEGLPEEQRLVVRYEELRSDTPGQLQRIYAWLGVHPSPEALADAARRLSFERLGEDQRGSGKFARAASPGAWRENLASDEQAVIERAIGWKLRELGYA